MQIQVLLFGIVADLVGENSIILDIVEKSSVASFKEQMISEYPQLKSYTTYAVAINEVYAQNDAVIKANDIIAIIPPVSGG